MSNFFGSIWWLLITLGVLVTFHEYGHFWVGRYFGVKVLRFSVGFGKPIWSRRGKDGTEYAIGGIPLGGYVKFLDEREGDVDPADIPYAFNNKPVWQRMLIVAAGPVFNIVLCVFFLWMMLVVGRPDFAPVVGQATGIAAEAGIQRGDRILNVDGEEAATWNDAMPLLARSGIAHRPVSVELRSSDGQMTNRTLALDRLPESVSELDLLPSIGLKPMHWTAPPVLGVITKGGPAEGQLQVGDRVLSINGQPVGSFEDIGPLVQQAPDGQPVTLMVERAGQQVSVALLPQVDKGRKRLGIGARAPAEPAYDTVQRMGPLAAIPAAIRETGALLRDSVNMIGRMISGRAPREAVSGPVTIARVANASAQMGPAWFLRFLALMSLSLGVLNLLPIPVLDGGHLMFYTIEALRGRPLGERAMAIGQSVGMMLLLGLMSLAFYNDLLGLVR